MGPTSAALPGTSHHLTSRTTKYKYLQFDVKFDGIRLTLTEPGKDVLLATVKGQLNHIHG